MKAMKSCNDCYKRDYCKKECGEAKRYRQEVLYRLARKTLMDTIMKKRRENDNEG